MNKVETLQYVATLRHASQGNFFYWTPEILKMHDGLSKSKRARLKEWQTQLFEYIHSTRDPKKWRPYTAGDDRIALLREHPANSDLYAIACLWPGTSDKSQERDFSKPMTEDELEYATQWLCEAVRCLECFDLLPTKLRREWLAHCTSKKPPSSPLETIAILVTVTWDKNFEESDLYLNLSQTSGRRLARIAVGLLESETLAGGEIAEHILEHLGCLVPGSIQECHEQLLEHQVFCWGFLYRDVVAGISKQLIAMENLVSNFDCWLKSLAWIGDRAVQKQFDDWRRHPSKKWKTRIFVEPHLYCHEAGWELTPQGKRRSLCFESCYRLVPAKDSESSSKLEPVGVAILREDRCGHCGHPLTNLFDLDLTDPRFAFLKMHGTRLRIVTCTSCWSCVYCNFDLEGNSSWSSESEKPNDVCEDFYPLTPRSIALGEPCATPIEPLLHGGGSYLGGYPNWINDAAFPSCPNCKRLMMYLACINADRIGGNGNIYSFLCRDCCMAATTYDCT